MKIRKKELKNIIAKDWNLRRAASQEKRAKASKATKEWKARIPRARRLLARLAKSENPWDQADAAVLKELLQMIKYDF